MPRMPSRFCPALQSLAVVACLVAGLPAAFAAAPAALQQRIEAMKPSDARIQSRLFGRENCWRRLDGLQAWAGRAVTAPFSPRPWFAQVPTKGQRWAALDAVGQEVELGARLPSCLVDRLTGLTWATGIDQGTALRRDHAQIAPWVGEVNQRKFCGVEGWRLARRDELLSLTLHEAPAADDLEAFWGGFFNRKILSATPSAIGPQPVYFIGHNNSSWSELHPQAWYVEVPEGLHVLTALDREPHLVLLVRASTCHVFGEAYWK